MLELKEVSRRVAGVDHLAGISLRLTPGVMNVLLGPARAGKTSLMRVMAGLDRPGSGSIWFDGTDVTGKPVAKRNVAMVYQQFINYPSMTVFDNIASPLHLRGDTGVRERVHALAEKLHIEMFLERYPSELSGGQQQRVALARALAKGAPLMLLDEPLVNLDYKLREELRDELSALFAAGNSTVVYATTEPGEALLLGGYTAVMDAGQLLQYGPTAEVFQRPRSIRVATAFSDPPMNLFPARVQDQALVLADASRVTLASALAGGPVTAGLRASALRVQAREGDVAVKASVALAEISGSDTFVHLDTALGAMVAQLAGVHYFDLGDAVAVYFRPQDVFVFDSAGMLALAPTREGVH